MVLEVKKQERETAQSLIRRFGRGVQQSGILVRARHLRFRQKPKNKQTVRKAALRREQLKKEYQRLKKLGKLEYDSKRKN